MTEDQVVQPCPTWCARDDGPLPVDFPDDGFWHYGEPVTIPTTDGSFPSAVTEPLLLGLQAWVPHLTASPGSAVIGLRGTSEGVDLTLAQARHLADALLGLINQAAAEPAP